MLTATDLYKEFALHDGRTVKVRRVLDDAITRRDYPMVTGAAILAAAMVVLGNLLADVAARVADPRLRQAS